MDQRWWSISNHGVRSRPCSTTRWSSLRWDSTASLIDSSILSASSTPLLPLDRKALCDIISSRSGSTPATRFYCVSSSFFLSSIHNFFSSIASFFYLYAVIASILSISAISLSLSLMVCHCDMGWFGLCLPSFTGSRSILDWSLSLH